MSDSSYISQTGQLRLTEVLLNRISDAIQGWWANGMESTMQTSGQTNT
jgi:hypothetical protein